MAATFSDREHMAGECAQTLAISDSERSLGQTHIGFKGGMALYVSDAALAQIGERGIREVFGIARRYPVKADLSGNIVMAEGDTHNDAVQRYLSRTMKANAAVTHD